MKYTQIIKGDIAVQNVEALVLAANSLLMPGNGVSGAIHRAAGPELWNECQRLNGCEVGETKVTRGYNLQASWVIHTVGPKWCGGRRNEEEALARCYQQVFARALELGVRSIALPSISTGAYRFPVEKAVPIAIKEIEAGLARASLLERVIVASLDDGVIAAFELGGWPSSH